MKTTTITFLFLLVCNNCFSQDFKNYEIKRLKTFEINTDTTELYNSLNYLNLKGILEKEQKRRSNKTFAIVLTSLSALTMTYASKMITDNRNDQEGLGESIGTMVLVVGIIELGVSIPLFISSNKKRKERDKLIELYKK